MPVQDPQLGETWELTTPHMRATQGIVVGLSEGSPNTASHVRLIGRSGRITPVAKTLFRLGWNFLHEAQPHPCWYANRSEACTRTAYFQVQGADTEAGWVCQAHIPVGTMIVFPFDRPAPERMPHEVVSSPVVQRAIRGEAPVLPAVGSIWTHVSGHDVVRIDQVDVEAGAGEIMFAIQSIQRSDLRLIRAREFFQNYRLGTPTEEPSENLEPPEVRPDFPQPGDTWWDREAKLPVMVTDIILSNSGERYVAFVGIRQAGRIVLSETVFLEQFQFDVPTLTFAPDEEWYSPATGRFCVKHVDMAKRVVKGITASGEENIPLMVFLAKFERFYPVTTHERILAWDED